MYKLTLVLLGLAHSETAWMLGLGFLPQTPASPANRSKTSADQETSGGVIACLRRFCH